MGVEADLYTKLSTYGGLTALVGSRIKPAPLPEDIVLPAVSWQLVSDPPNMNLSGVDNFRQPRFQVTAWANSRLATIDVAEQILAALDNWTAGAVQFAVCMDGTDLYDGDFSPARYGRAIDVQISYSKA